MPLIKKILVAILTLESRLIVSKYKPFVVAVTGSVGKTSTKDAIYSVLKDRSRFVRKSEKSMNSEIGLPLTVIGVPNAWHSLLGWMKNVWAGVRLIVARREYPDCLVLEVGADHPGDIQRITSWLHPDIAVVTRISDTPVHVEFFNSPEEVFEEKAFLAKAVKPGGTLILFGDDVKSDKMRERVSGKDIKIISYGTVMETDVKGSGYSVSYEQNDGIRVPVGFAFSVRSKDQSETLKMKGILGDVYQYPLLAAAAVGIARDLPLSEIIKSLSAYEAPRGRMNILAGINGSTIIDDTYNSSPDAVLSALHALKNLECSGSRIAVLGDMMELGKYSVEEHRRIGREAAAIVGRLITIGARARGTADEAVRNGLPADAVRSFDASDEAAPAVAALVKKGDIVLVKGSQSPRLERVTKALLREPGEAAKLLVRQEKEWLDKA